MVLGPKIAYGMICCERSFNSLEAACGSERFARAHGSQVHVRPELVSLSGVEVVKSRGELMDYGG